jgi:glycosyltransferase involved in cell wall biosynthesis
MKVLHFYKTYYPDTFGGAEQAIQQICLATAAQGVKNNLLALSPSALPERIEYPSLSVVRVRRQGQIASMDMAAGAFRAFREMAAQVDLVHVHYPWPFMDVVLWASDCKVPIVVTYHSDIIRQRVLKLAYAPLERWLLHRADQIVATSPNYMESSANLRRFADKTLSIPLALDESSYSLEKAALPAPLKANGFMLFVGMLRYYKGLHTLVQAAQDLPFQVVIAGAGPEEQSLMASARALNAQNIVFLGRVSEAVKMRLLQECVAFVFPSNQRSEAFGVSLLEAAMCGKPMLTCEIGTGTSFVNINGETGLVVPPDDPMRLRQAMLQLWDDSQLRQKLAHGARLRFEQTFTAGDMGKSYLRVYERLLTN